jgi:spermidine/putrescine transport system substrate-binding protein
MLSTHTQRRLSAVVFAASSMFLASACSSSSSDTTVAASETAAAQSEATETSAAVAVETSAVAGAAETSAAADAVETSAAAAPAAGSAGSLNVANWTDYTSPDLIKKFEAESGVKVTLDTYDSNETLLAKIQAGGGGYDVIVPSDYMVAQMVTLGLLEKVDAAAMPNGKNIDPAFLDVYFDKGRAYTVPYLYGTTGIAVDTGQVKNPPKSWKEFFTMTEETAGKIGILNDQSEVLNAALKATGNKPCTNDPAAWEAVSALLKDFKGKVQVINSDDVIGRMSTGEQAMHMMWNGAFHRAKEKNAKLEYVFPSDTLNLWQDNLAVVKGAKNLDNAKKFLNFMADPVNSAIAVNAQGYAAGITGVGDLVSDALKADPAVNPTPANAALGVPTPPCDAETVSIYDKVWTEFKS